MFIFESDLNSLVPSAQNFSLSLPYQLFHVPVVALLSREEHPHEGSNLRDFGQAGLSILHH